MRKTIGISLLTMLLACSTYASDGIIQNPVVGPPPPPSAGQQLGSAGEITNDVTGDIQNPVVSPLTLSLLQSVLALF